MTLVEHSSLVRLSRQSSRSSQDLARETRNAIELSNATARAIDPHLFWIKCASSDVPHRSAPSSPSTSHGAFSRRKMCFRTFGGSHLMLSRSTELIVNDTSSSWKEYIIEIGAPHLEQNDLSAMSESFRNSRVESSVKASVSLDTPVNGM